MKDYEIEERFKIIDNKVFRLANKINDICDYLNEFKRLNTK